MKRIALAIALSGPAIFPQASAEACSSTCIEDRLIFDEAGAASRSTKVVFTLPDFIPGRQIPLLVVAKPPLVMQEFEAIEASDTSGSRWIVDRRAIDEANKCIASGSRACAATIGIQGAVKNLLVTQTYRVSVPQYREIGASGVIDFVPGLSQSVTLEGFSGRYRVEGVEVDSRGSDDNVLRFKTLPGQEGRLIFSSIGRWKDLIGLWKAPDDVESLAGIRSEVRSALRHTRREDIESALLRWVAENIEYKSQSLTPDALGSRSSFRSLADMRVADCKGMTALLGFLLDDAGIESQVVLTRVGNLDGGIFDPDVPLAGYFDHVLLYSPGSGRYLDATVGIENLDEDISDYLDVAVNLETGDLHCFSKQACVSPDGVLGL